jgi:cytosine/adenosine deaminase-related metal-dependent hydrolase
MTPPLICLGDYVITMDTDRRIIEDGAVVVEDDRIAEIGPREKVLSRYSDCEILGGDHRLVMPGLINGHIHLPQFMMRGVNDEVGCLTLLTEYIWPIQGCYDEEDALISTRLGLLEMLKSGTTCFLSTGLHPRYGMDGICSGVEESGLRGVISKYVFQGGGFSGNETAIHRGLWEDGEVALRQAEELIQNWNGRGGGRIQVWISPRSVGAGTPEYYRRASDLARRYGVGLTAHWSQVKENAEFIRKTYDTTPAGFADLIGLLTEKSVLVHGIYFEDGDFDLMAAAGTTVCHCPVCNTKLCMGIARVKEMREAGVNVCLGNDGMPDNNTADLFREMRTYCLLQRELYNDPTQPSSMEALELATVNGARALGLQDEIGSIEPGKKADLIILDLNRPHLVPVIDPVNTVVWSANGSDVETVLVDGRILMEKREVFPLDEPQILEAARGRLDKVLSQAGLLEK